MLVVLLLYEIYIYILFFLVLSFVLFSHYIMQKYLNSFIFFLLNSCSFYNFLPFITREFFLWFRKIVIRKSSKFFLGYSIVMHLLRIDWSHLLIWPSLSKPPWKKKTFRNQDRSKKNIFILYLSKRKDYTSDCRTLAMHLMFIGVRETSIKMHGKCVLVSFFFLT